EIAKRSTEFAIWTAVLANNDRGQFRVGFGDFYGILQLFFIDKHTSARLLSKIVPRPGIVDPGVCALQGRIPLGEGAVLRLVLLHGVGVPLHVLVEERHGVGVVTVGVQVKSQLVNGKALGLELARERGGLFVLVEDRKSVV